MSDEELDKTFRKAADEFSADFDMSSWNDMADKLDRAAEHAIWYRSRIMLVILFSVLMVGSLTFWFANLAKVERHDVNNTILIDEPESAEQNAKAAQKNSIQPATGKQEVKTLPLVVLSEEVEKFSTTSNIVSAKNRSVKEVNSKEKFNLEESIIDKGKTISQKDIDHSKAVPSSLTKIDSIVVEEIEDEDTVLLDSSAIGNPEKEHQSRNGYFSLKISVAPDFSSTELFNQGKPGFDFGITTVYNFNERWALFTGVILAKKVYSSTNVEGSYNTSNGYNYPIDQLDGDCRILDIPLNVYYSFNQNQSLSFKVGFGFSSYIMLSEYYTYFVNKPYGASEYYQRVENENNEWFKMMNLSFMIQQRLNDHLFLEVEPFVKIPMTGIGAGDISLYSVGSFVSLRYDFYKRLKK